MVDIIGDLKQEILELKRRIHVLESASPLGQSSVSEGALEIRSEEGLIVIGSIRISGVMNGDGTITWTGPWNLTGLGTVTGDADWSGDINLTGIIEVGGPTGVTINGATGEIAVNGAFPVRLRQVGGGAVIEVGGTTISVQDGLLKIDAGSGTGVFQDGFGIQLKSGGVAFAAGSFGPQIVGLPTTQQVNYPGSFPGAVVANSTGQLFRVV